MPNNANYRNLSGFADGNVLCLNSLDVFRKQLEKAYFANVVLRKYSDNEHITNLVVEFQSNLSLVEFLYYIQKRNIGQMTRKTEGHHEDLALSNALKIVREVNAKELYVEELTFFLADTEITIKEIYKNSIEEQIGNIYSELSKHFMCFTKNQERIPSEIFIPVFEENLEEKFKKGITQDYTTSSKRDYFNFWGIYFSHTDDAVIYDLSRRSIISGDLYMLD